MGLVWEMLQTATTLRPVSRWPWHTLLLLEWRPGGYHTISRFRCASERREDKNQSSHRRLGICLHNSVLHRDTLLLRRDHRYFIFRHWQFLDIDNCQESLHNLIWCSMPTLDFVSMILNFQGMSREHQEKHPDDMVSNQEQGTVFYMCQCHGIKVHKTLGVTRSSPLRALSHSLTMTLILPPF